MTSYTLALSIAAFVLPWPVHAQSLTWHDYTLRAYDGRTTAAQTATLSVPETSDRGSATVDVAVVRLRSTASKPAAPIVWLAGGPGIPGIVMGQVPPYYDLFNKLRETADVILIDQRGTGTSKPAMSCAPSARALANDVLTTLDRVRAEVHRIQLACLNEWRTAGRYPEAYNTVRIVSDLEYLRKALGAERISLLAFSYGTEVALEYVRRHDKNVERAALAGIRGPDQLLKLPSTIDTQLVKIATLYADSLRSAPPDSILSLVRQVTARLDREPATITITDAAKSPRNVLVGSYGFQLIVANNLNSASSVRVPALIAMAAAGDYTRMTPFVEQITNGLATMSAMAFVANCSSGWTAQRLAKTKAEAQRSPLGDAINVLRGPAWCDGLGKTWERAGLAPVKSAKPALFITGMLDPNGPLFAAEEVQRGFSNGQSVIVENGWHETLPMPSVQEAVVKFFRAPGL